MRVLIFCALVMILSAAMLLAEPYRTAHGRPVYFADAVFPVFDPNAKDVFVFNGNYAPRSPGVVAGIDQEGREVRVLPAQVVTPEQARQQAPQRRRQQEQKAPAKAAPLASFRPACASCHTRGTKSAGGVSIYDESGKLALAAAEEWAEVVAEVESGRMPPPDSNKPKPSPGDLAEARRRANPGE